MPAGHRPEEDLLPARARTMTVEQVRKFLES
jgi:hypothetical protein